MSKFSEAYQAKCAALRAECDEMVMNGELSQEDANFRYWMVEDEILDAMDENDYAE